ncbi:MAG: terminase small subunit, partial [Pseudomonadota bacterium]
MVLTPKQRRFVEEYLVDLNATQAAIRAGYSQKTARSIGQQNLTKLDITHALADAMKERTERTELSADWVIQRLRENVERSMQRVPVLDQEGKPNCLIEVVPSTVSTGGPVHVDHYAEIAGFNPTFWGTSDTWTDAAGAA